MLHEEKNENGEPIRKHYLPLWKSLLKGRSISFLQIFFVVLLFAFLHINPAFAGDKIKIHLHQPPPNKLGVSELWKLDIENTTRENLTIYLQGTISEAKDGLIAEGQSKPFVIKPGRSSYGYDDFKNGTVSWKNNSYQEAIVRTGNAPSGSYTICATAKLESGEPAGQENCIEQNVEITTQQQILLISPASETELDPDTLPGIVFLWNRTGPCPPHVMCNYSLRIVEIKGSQSPDVAFQNNSVFYELKDIKEPKFQYPQSAPKFAEGKKYAWQITSGDVKSGVGSFTYKNSPIHPHGNPRPNLLLTVELIQNNNSVAKVTTGNDGKFSFKDVPDGEYGLKITGSGSESPEYYLMTIGGVGIIICCCPGPPCEDPLVIFIGSKITRKNKALFLNKNEITAMLCPCKDCCPPPQK